MTSLIKLECTLMEFGFGQRQWPIRRETRSTRSLGWRMRPLRHARLWVWDERTCARQRLVRTRQRLVLLRRLHWLRLDRRRQHGCDVVHEGLPRLSWQIDTLVFEWNVLARLLVEDTLADSAVRLSSDQQCLSEKLLALIAIDLNRTQSLNARIIFRISKLHFKINSQIIQINNLNKTRAYIPKEI